MNTACPSVNKYAAAFRTLGGITTATKLSVLLGITVQAAHQFLTRHTGRFVRRTGKSKEGTTYQWIRYDNPPL